MGHIWWNCGPGQHLIVHFQHSHSPVPLLFSKVSCMTPFFYTSGWARWPDRYCLPTCCQLQVWGGQRLATLLGAICLTHISKLLYTVWWVVEIKWWITKKNWLCCCWCSRVSSLCQPQRLGNLSYNSSHSRYLAKCHQLKVLQGILVKGTWPSNTAIASHVLRLKGKDEIMYCSAQKSSHDWIVTLHRLHVTMSPARQLSDVGSDD